LSSGISANILDFDIPEKHVLSPDLLSQQARETGLPDIAPVPTAGSKGRKPRE
jgi:hypothetical protein